MKIMSRSDLEDSNMLGSVGKPKNSSLFKPFGQAAETAVQQHCNRAYRNRPSLPDWDNCRPGSNLPFKAS